MACGILLVEVAARTPRMPCLRREGLVWIEAGLKQAPLLFGRARTVPGAGHDPLPACMRRSRRSHPSSRTALGTKSTAAARHATLPTSITRPRLCRPRWLAKTSEPKPIAVVVAVSATAFAVAP